MFGDNFTMYLIFHRKNSLQGEVYTYWTLVESVRITGDLLQHTVATLGKLPGLECAETQSMWRTLQINGWLDVVWAQRLECLSR